MKKSENSPMALSSRSEEQSPILFYHRIKLKSLNLDRYLRMLRGVFSCGCISILAVIRTILRTNCFTSPICDCFLVGVQVRANANYDRLLINKRSDACV